MLPDLGHLPPGTPALLLIVGGLVLVVPTACATLLTFSTRMATKERPVRRVVLTRPREPRADQLPLHNLTLLDAALERVYRSGLGEPRILQAEPHRKVVRIWGCSCALNGGTCDASRAALERVVGEALGRRPSVVEHACGEGVCDYVLTY